jgi:hypothetical protein
MAVEPAVDEYIDSLHQARNLDLDVAGELCRRAAQLVAAGRFAM